MRILLTADPFIPVPPKIYGGIERIVSSLITKLRSHGHTVGLVALAGSTAEVDYFHTWTHSQPSTPITHLQNAMALHRAFREFSPDIIHSFSRLLYLAPLLASRVAKVMSYQRTPGGPQITLAGLIGGQSLAFTGCSQFIANIGRRFSHNWQAIPNFVDTDLFRFCPSVADDAPLLFLSRIESIKGAHLAIDTAKRTGRRLLLAGNYADDGVERQYWNNQIKPELGRNRIEYVGPVDDRTKIDLLRSAAAMIVPIQWDEPFGIVFAEALACGTPVISCPRGAVPEIVRDGIEGFLVHDIDEACHAVSQIYKIDKTSCRRRAEDIFSADVVSRQYEALYTSLVQRE